MGGQPGVYLLERRAADDGGVAAMRLERMDGAMTHPRETTSALIKAYGTMATVAAVAALPLLGVICAVSEKRRQTVFKRLLPSLTRPIAPGSLWLHALSVGEVLSAEPLLDRMQASRHRRHVCLTTSTLTGQYIADERFGRLVDALGYFPFDVPFAIHRSLRRIAPKVVVLMESDIWPGFMAAVRQQGVPVVLANARLSERSFRGYQRFPAVTRPMMRTMAHICCQSETDAGRFAALGVPPSRLTVTGSMKFDQVPPVLDDAARQSLRRQLGIAPRAPILLAASTHPGEEGHLLTAYAMLRRRVHGLRFILVPRDPRRAQALCRRADALDSGSVLYSRLESTAAAGDPVVVVDRMGVLARLAAISQVAFIGGSLVPAGGHNPLEAAAHGVPVLLGPDMRDFQDMADWLLADGGALRVDNAADIAHHVAMLITGDQGRSMGEAARGVFLRHSGAADRIMAVIDQLPATSVP
ncbi:MAG: 3-deoxy-D-manno-octulosonic acid transferase, partial [Anaerolineae bacterium]